MIVSMLVMASYLQVVFVRSIMLYRFHVNFVKCVREERPCVDAEAKDRIKKGRDIREVRSSRKASSPKQKSAIRREHRRGRRECAKEKQGQKKRSSRSACTNFRPIRQRKLVLAPLIAAVVNNQSQPSPPNILRVDPTVGW